MKEVRCELRTYVTDLVGRGKELLGQSLEKQAQKPWSGRTGESQGRHGQGMNRIFNIQRWLQGCCTLIYDHLKKIFLALFRHMRKQEGRQYSAVGKNRSSRAKEKKSSRANFVNLRSMGI